MDTMLAEGTGKTEVFRQLSGQGVKDRLLATWLANKPDLQAFAEMRLHVNILTGLMVLQALIILGITASVSVFLGLALMLIPLLFAWGFRQPRAGAYNAYVFLSIITLGRNATHMFPLTAGSIVGFAISLGMIGYVFWVQRRLFPDTSFVGPNRKGRQFVFTT
ncbi:hypothetical protein ACQ86G_03450 [Roseateles chitinivorans]|uniref:hypothetical protein n=1 Tax=Roseateles chitinivorans TaxID=2917965 RepID=UPI003D67977D